MVHSLRNEPKEIKQWRDGRLCPGTKKEGRRNGEESGKQKTPLVAQRGLKIKLADYFRRRNRSSEAPPKAAKASVPGSGTGVTLNIEKPGIVVADII